MSAGPGTFAYVFEVGDDRRAPMKGRVWDPAHTAQRLSDPAPVLEWMDVSPEPWKEYARVTVTGGPSDSDRPELSFTVERGLMTVLRPKDHVYVVAGPAIGLSVVHDDFLVAAAGPADVLSCLPLGSEVEVHFPGEDLQARFFRQPDSPTYYLGGPPPAGPFVEIRVAGECRIMPWGRPTIGPYEVFVRASARPGIPLISIERLKICPETSVHTTAQLLDRHGFVVDRPEGQ